MKCSNCGTDLEQGAKFCPVCGTPAPIQNNIEQPAAPPPPPVQAACANCGTVLEQGAKFCPVCGTSVHAATPPPQQQAGTVPPPLPPLGAVGPPPEPKKPFFEQLNETEDTTDSFDQEDIDLFQRISVVAYLGWLVLIPIICFPKSKFTRFHSNQGIIMAILMTAFYIVIQVIWMIVWRIGGWFGWIVTALAGIITLAGSVVLIYLIVTGIINAVKKRAKQLPLVGKIKILKMD